MGEVKAGTAIMMWLAVHSIVDLVWGTEEDNLLGKWCQGYGHYSDLQNCTTNVWYFCSVHNTIWHLSVWESRLVLVGA